MITADEIKSAIGEVKPLFTKLQTIYQSLPDTHCSCDEPGVCCAFLPEMTWLEALQWASFIRDMPKNEKTVMLRKFVEFFLTTPMRHSGCPFLVTGKCGIYEYRTFGCRAYGLWSRHMGDTRTQDSRRSRDILLKLWKRFGVELPKNIVGSEINYCIKVVCLSDRHPGDDELMKILQKVYQLDKVQPELQKKFEDEYHSDFSFLISSIVLGQRKAILGKFAVTKEMVQRGTQKHLQIMLDKVHPDVFGNSNNSH